MKNILIVSNSYDLHAELVEPIIRSKGAKVFRLNLDQFPKEYEFDWALASAETFAPQFKPGMDSIKL